MSAPAVVHHTRDELAAAMASLDAASELIHAGHTLAGLDELHSAQRCIAREMEADAPLPERTAHTLSNVAVALAMAKSNATMLGKLRFLLAPADVSVELHNLSRAQRAKLTRKLALMLQELA